MSSQQPANSAATQPPADPRRPKPNSGVAPPRAKPPQGAKPVAARPGAPRKNLKTSTPAKPAKKKSESWLDSIKSAFSCCSKKKSPVQAKRPMTKPPMKPGVKAVPGVKPGIKVTAKNAPPRSDSSVRPSRKAMAQARAKAKLAPRGKTRELVSAESAKTGSKSRSKEKVKKGSRSKEHNKKSKEQPTGESQKVVLVESGKKRGSKEKAKPESKEYINSKRPKEPVVEEPALKTAEYLNEDEVSKKTDREEKKKSKKEKKREAETPDPSKPVQSLYIDRFIAQDRQVFRWTYEESFPEGEQARGMAKLFEHRPREIDRSKPVAPKVCKKAKEPQAKPTPTTSAVETENETPKRKKREENYFDPQEVLRKTKKIQEYVDPEKVLCCFCCDCQGNQELRKKKMNEIKLQN